jgi:transmembrane sensor
MNNTRLALLFELFYNQKSTPEERKEFLDLLEIEEAEIKKLIDKAIESETSEIVLDETNAQSILTSILQADGKPEALVIQLSPWRKYMVAAIVFLIVATSGFLLLQKNETNNLSEQLTAQKKEEIVPGGDKAILTLADGTNIILDSSLSGSITKQGNVTIINLNGKLEYNASNETSQVLYNTITTPMGGQYQLELADGSKVWLNAASSLRFPTSFAGTDRTVELTGEGYFEVAHNPNMPFQVKVNDMEVQVLGTEFNINAYDNEPVIKTTLLLGRVRVKNQNKHVFLNPGQQAILKTLHEDIKIAHNVDVDEVVAWKNAHFLFNSTDIEAVMRQIERWYDVNVIYKNKTTETISGSLPRSQNISQLLKVLEATGNLEFKVNGKNIMVSSK